MLETYYPWHITQYEMITDSGGAGAYRGGLGIHWEGANTGSPAILLTGDSDGDAPATNTASSSIRRRCASTGPQPRRCERADRSIHRNRC
jgi:hypothetical protein